MIGTALRLQRLLPTPGRGVFGVPLDHSVSMGPIEGLESLRPLVAELQASGVDLLILPKGAVRQVAPELRPSTLLGVHLSASTTLGSAPHHKVLVGTAAEAVGLGADLVSVQVNFGIDGEGEMLSDLGRAVDQAHALGLPLLSMTYVKREGASPDELRHACRAAADLGADLVKTSYPGSEEELRRLVRSTPVPVLLGGGDRIGSDEQLVDRCAETLRAGARGICFGRNLFQRRPVGPLAKRLAEVLHGAPARTPS